MKVYVIKDMFAVPLYYVHDIEWTNDIIEARWFDSEADAHFVRDRIPYPHGEVTPYSPFENFGYVGEGEAY